MGSRRHVTSEVADWALGSGSNLPGAIPPRGFTRQQVYAARMALLAAWLRLTDGQVPA